MVTRALITGALFYLGFFALMLLPDLIGYRQLAFRDVGHFYLPLYEYVHQRISEGDLPLWNPLDRFGVPILGETTTAVFYPGGVVFHLGLPSEQAMAVYVWLHLALAGINVFLIGQFRKWSWTVSTAAGLAYAAAGPVVFLYSNPPFLVSAAWLPLGVWGLYHAASARNTRWFCAAVLASVMMILGGDIQTVVNLYLIQGLISAYRFLTERLPKQFAQEIGVLIAAGVLVALMASIQLAPTFDWALNSGRLALDIDQIAPDDFAKHNEQIYQYSVGPWQWLGAVVPRVCGNLFPINTRWTVLVDGTDQTWTPSLYAGLFPALCVLLYLFHSRRENERQDSVGLQGKRLVFGLMIAGLGFSLGGYGIGWLWNSLALTNQLEPEFGGPYSWLRSLVPGYSGFRYPAKWLVFFSLGLSLCTGEILYRFRDSDRLVVGRLCRWYPVATGLVVFSSLLFVYSRLSIAPLPIDSFFGPFDYVEFQWILAAALLQSVVGCLVVGYCAMSGRISKERFIAIVCWTLAIEMLLSGRSLIGDVPADNRNKSLF